MIGPGYVPCVLTGRWLRFPNHSGAYLRERECMIVEVISGLPRVAGVHVSAHNVDAGTSVPDAKNRVRRHAVEAGLLIPQPLAVTEFRPSYKRATVMQASLALIGAASGITRWGAEGGLGWLVGGVLLGSVVPFTLLVILPTNNRLLDPSLDKASPEAGVLLARWGRLHAVRSVASFVAFVTFLILLATG